MGRRRALGNGKDREDEQECGLPALNEWFVRLLAAQWKNGTRNLFVKL